MENLKKLLSLAESQVGYQEKKSPANLDDADANAGRGNYTKYSRDVGKWGLAGCQGQPWCATYQFWLEAKIFGVEKALEHFHMDRDSYRGYNCFSIYEAFKRAGRTSENPEVGALVVFRHSHIGRVTDIRNGKIYTNEGNTSALYGDRNGGTVKNKQYNLTDRSIKGYCIIAYDTKNEIKDFQKWMNGRYSELLETCCGGLLKEDGIYGKNTRNAALAVWKELMNRYYGTSLTPGNPAFGEKCRSAAKNAMIKYGSKGAVVAIAQRILSAKGYYQGKLDEIYGQQMKIAVYQIQQDYGIQTDGVIGKNTWEILLIK